MFHDPCSEFLFSEHFVEDQTATLDEGEELEGGGGGGVR
jgi:hypothetical protein